jgi:tetratricopeptide (TPR) repeat protein
VLLEDNILFMILIGKRNFHTYLISDQEANKCKTMFKRLINDHPEDEMHEAYFGLAKIYFHLNRLDVAYDCIYKAVKFRPQDSVYLLWKGLILFYILQLNQLGKQL